MKEHTFYGTAYIKQKIKITLCAPDSETAEERAMDYLEDSDIEDYVIDPFAGEVEFEFDEYESTVINP